MSSGTEVQRSGDGRLAGRAAVVTGVGSGLGRAIAGELAAEGASVLGCGVNVNVASILALVGDGILAAYCAAKGGVLGITRATAVQYGSVGIRCNAICPGDIDTPLVQAYFETAGDPEALRRQVSGAYPLGRIAQPREIARAVVFLASDDSSFMTGEAMVV